MENMKINVLGMEYRIETHKVSTVIWKKTNLPDIVEKKKS